MKKNLLILVIGLCTLLSIGQTTIINPSGDGGFETGASFGANGWTVVNNATNAWYVGTAPTGYSGARCAYISNNSGTSHAYTITTAQVSHFYRNVTFPAGETDITLTFNWKGYGESTYDYLQVFIVPTTTTPVAGTQLTTGQIGSTYYNLQSNWQTATITIPSSYAGTTQRLVFSWRNDASAGTQPPSAIDNISLISRAPYLMSNTPITTCSGQWFT